MNQTTEHPVFQNRNHTIVLWVILLAAAILIPSELYRSTRLDQNIMVTPFPWIYFCGRMIADGLKMFSGELPTPYTSAQIWGDLVSILVVYIVCPTLFLFGLRNRASERKIGKELHIIRWSTFK